MNLIIYHGVLAPNAKWRREVVRFGHSKADEIAQRDIAEILADAIELNEIEQTLVAAE